MNHVYEKMVSGESVNVSVIYGGHI